MTTIITAADPGEWISERDFAALIKPLLHPPPWAGESEARAKIMAGDWHDLLVAKIREVHSSPYFASQVELFATTTINVAQVIATNVAVVYKMGARRLVDSEATSDALRRFYAEAGADARAPAWNRLAFATGPVLVVPRVTAHGTGRMDTLTADRYMVLRDPEDPLMAPPLAAVWRLDDGAHDGAKLEMVDGAAFYRVGPHGQILNLVEHGAGICPAVIMRTRLPEPRDPHEVHATSFLATATLLVGYFFARLNMRRKQQDGKTTTLAGNVERMPTQQALIAGERPLVLETAGGEDVSVNVYDLNLSPDAHIRHIRAIIEWTVEQMGIPQSSVTFDTIGKETDSVSLNVSAERLASLRSAQVPFFRRAEKELAVKSAAMMRAQGHPLAPVVDVDSVLESFRVEFPDLDRAGDPLEMSRLEDWELSHMLIDEVDLVMRRHPEMTRAQAAAYLEGKIETRSTIAAALAERNLVMDPSRGMLSTPQVFGRMGGRPTQGNDQTP